VPNRDPLDRVAQGHLGFRGRFLFPVPVETGPAHRRQLTHPHDAQSALRFHPPADFGVEAISPELLLF
jgi:hypothetical protein